ncbi:MAG: DNA repair exonuclease [Deltaproteobacteria bacterium]
MINILHTADFHLGRHFRDHPEAQDKLIQARYDTLESVVRLANEKKSDILSIAGDLFDRTSMNTSDVQRAVRAINGFSGKVVLVLPGNHDYITEDSELWSRFAKEADEHVIVLSNPKPMDLQEYDLKAMVYPGPCNAKHSNENAIGWIREVEKNQEMIQIGIAHGSIEGVSPDFEQRYYPMILKELKNTGVNIWLLGHTHVTWPEKPGNRDLIFNPGTPEPDGFDCRHEGHAFFITINENKEIEAEILSTGTYLFVQRLETLEKEQDLKKLVDSITKDDYSHVVLQLTLEGHLDPELYDEWRSTLPTLRKNVLELKLHDSDLVQRVTREQIRQEFPEGSFPYRLLSEFFEDEDEQALQMAYEIIQEVKDEN